MNVGKESSILHQFPSDRMSPDRDRWVSSIATLHSAQPTQESIHRPKEPQAVLSVGIRTSATAMTLLWTAQTMPHLW